MLLPSVARCHSADYKAGYCPSYENCIKHSQAPPGLQLLNDEPCLAVRNVQMFLREFFTFLMFKRTKVHVHSGLPACSPK
jgi:hypothetical protein